MAVAPVQASLSDRYEARAGRVHLTGIQALARLPIDQSRRDRSGGRTIGTYISGYEGSPLAGYDLELIRQRDMLHEHDITFAPGLNEEAAAMAVQGSQLIGELPATVDGVTGFWYGKAPGLDRATDAFRHANLMGTHPQGGAVAFVGDDPAAKSSSVPCASEHALADLGMPTFFPADAGEILEMGRHAVALSRASGLWTALKIVTAVADGSATVDLLEDPAPPVLPDGSGRHEPTGKLLQPRLGPLERDFATTRMRIVADYARLNHLNTTVAQHPGDRIGIIASGKTFLDLQEALADLGIDDEQLERAGIRLLKIGLIWPLEHEAIEAFADGLEEIIVVEDKRAFLEPAVRDVLYGRPAAPLVIGKRDHEGAELFAAYGELDVAAISLGLSRRLDALAPVQGWLARRREVVGAGLAGMQLPLLQRAPFYCSGCPHNTSTRPHTDSPVGAGIGCHAMVLLMDSHQVGDVVGLTQMGGEGTQWLGMAPFVEAKHFVQNIGDGTFHHSGSLAIRAAVASGANMTYRVLYNSTVAMTGGQDAVGQMDIAHMVEHLRSEGVARVIVTSDDVKAARKLGLPRSVSVWDRTRIAEAEQVLADTPGITVLIHEQECATELRRKRKRGLADKPRQAVVINERLCEGCGDCGEKSNCLSVHPVETEFGRKTTIHQSSCNTDLTCLSGDCPAFMTITPGKRRKAARPSIDTVERTDLPLPDAVRHAGHQNIRLMGVGGTGVVTTSQVLATAAVLSGYHVRTLDQTGLAQKGGAVVSDVKISDTPIHAGNKVGEGDCDLYLGYDLLVAANPSNSAVLSPSGTAIVSTSVVPTGAMVTDRTVSFPPVADALAPLSAVLDGGSVHPVDTRAYAETLFGAEQFANMFVLGIAHQLGALRLSDLAIEEAITLNGVAVDANVQAFRRGRQLVADQAALDRLVAQLSGTTESPVVTPSTIVAADAGSELERLVALRRTELVAYQNQEYAHRYEQLVERARAAEAGLGGGSRFSEGVARYAFKLMAYKDEYEVARLGLDAGTRAAIERDFGTDAKAAWRLHPPTLRAMGMKNKISLGRWFGSVFWILYRLRGLRGTPFDPFGHDHVRKEERRLVAEYVDLIEKLSAQLTVMSYDTAVELATLPDLVRGYGDVKLRSIEDYNARRKTLLARLGVAAQT